MTGRAVLIGVVAVFALVAFMILDGWFMKGDTVDECLSNTGCETAQKVEH